ncbi:MAG TPA: ABC transporter permease, partial [Blastocatellia bacterium]|nr:ABC transporter permease [Blastocatellia bacterium]
MLETIWRDIRFGIRMLMKNPGFTFVAVITLALGIGANTTIFSLTNKLLLRRLAVPHPEQIVVLSSPGPKPGHTWSDGDAANSFSYPLYQQLRQQAIPIVDLFARFPVAVNISGQGQTERAAGELVSGNYFQALQVTPAIGRLFTPADETAPGADTVGVLSFAYWSKHFGSNRSILNKTITVNGTSLTVVGVARAGFTGVQIGQLPDIFVPITMKPQMTPNWDGLSEPKDSWIAILGRLKPGFTATRAQAAMLPLYRAILESEAPQMRLQAASRQRFVEKPILLSAGSQGRPILQASVRQPLTILLAMVGLVL